MCLTYLTLTTDEANERNPLGYSKIVPVLLVKEYNQSIIYDSTANINLHKVKSRQEISLNLSYKKKNVNALTLRSPSKNINPFYIGQPRGMLYKYSHW